MQKVEIRVTPTHATLPIRSICGFLGSFDPPHKGHAWIVEQLLERFDQVLLLIPTFHFEKTVRFPFNATFEQRIEMLRSLAHRHPNRIAIGLAHEVLFLRLADRLAEQFPRAVITFGMGNETFERFLASQRYYTRMRLTWTAKEQGKLERLQKQIVVFGRSTDGSDVIPVPVHVRQISSTQVRETVRELRQNNASKILWQSRLERMITPEIQEFILKKGLYAGHDPGV